MRLRMLTLDRLNIVVLLIILSISLLASVWKNSAVLAISVEEERHDDKNYDDYHDHHHADDDDDDAVLLQKVKEWTVANGGYINHKVDIQQIQGSLYGLFANDAIAKNEIITSIPWKLVLRPPSGENATWCEIVETIRTAVLVGIGNGNGNGNGIDDDDDNNNNNNSTTTLHQKQEQQQQQQQQQTPYERYLAKRSRANVPICWSDQGKALWKELVSPMFPIFEGLDIEWDAEGCNHKNRNNNGNGDGSGGSGGITPFDDGHLQAMMLLKTRGEGPYAFDFIPIHDLLNHRNGKHTNVNPKYKEGKKYMIVASRDIEAGEQLQNSYNQCDWCEVYWSPPKGVKNYLVTPQIFELYGFVELYPQRWVIPRARMLFDIDIVDEHEDDDDDDDDDEDEDEHDLKVTFVVPPSHKGITFLAIQLGRLHSFQQDHDGARTDIPQVELEAIMSFHSAIVTAFENAIEQSVGQLSDIVWSWKEDEWYIEDGDDGDGDGDDEGSEAEDSGIHSVHDSGEL